MPKLYSTSSDISMPDAMGVPLYKDDPVAFFNSAGGKTIFGKVKGFNASTLVVSQLGKIKTYRKNSNQVIKISKEMLDQQRKIVTDALGVELETGNWVMTTGRDSKYSYYKSYGDFNGKLVFGELTKINVSSVEVRLKNKTTSIKKRPNQVLKVSEEQLTLYMFSQ